MAKTMPLRPFSAITGTREKLKVVDVGARVAEAEGATPYADLLKSGEAEVVGFEPDPEALAELVRRKGPLETYLPLAVGDGNRQTLHYCKAGGMNSLLPPNPAVLELFHGFPDWGRVLRTETVDTVRLDDVAEARGADLLKLDLQGCSLMALENATALLDDVLVIQAEVEFLPMYQGQPLFSEVELFLRGRGFAFHRFYPAVSRVVRPMLVDQNYRAGLSQLFWADALFMRDLTALGRLDDRQLLKMAMILHECYQSIDITLHLLTEYDRRNRTGLGGVYLDGLKTK